jgi:hypothetical protein
MIKSDNINSEIVQIWTLGRAHNYSIKKDNSQESSY